jgi:hypothetical protein
VVPPAILLLRAGGIGPGEKSGRCYADGVGVGVGLESSMLGVLRCGEPMHDE